MLINSALRMSRNIAMTAGILSAAALGLFAWWALAAQPSQADDPVDGLVDALIERVIEDPRSDDIVAVVNGEAVLRRTIITSVVFAERPRAEGPSSPGEALEQQIDQVLLRQAAGESGVTVTESEVDLLANNATEAYRDGILDDSEARLFRTLLEAGNIDTDQPHLDEQYRSALSGNLLVGRYLEERDRAVTIESLRMVAEIERYPERLVE